MKTDLTGWNNLGSCDIYILWVELLPEQHPLYWLLYLKTGWRTCMSNSTCLIEKERKQRKRLFDHYQLQLILKWNTRMIELLVLKTSSCVWRHKMWFVRQGRNFIIFNSICRSDILIILPQKSKCVKKWDLLLWPYLLFPTSKCQCVIVEKKNHRKLMTTFYCSAP